MGMFRIQNTGKPSVWYQTVTPTSAVISNCYTNQCSDIKLLHQPISNCYTNQYQTVTPTSAVISNCYTNQYQTVTPTSAVISNCYTNQYQTVTPTSIKLLHQPISNCYTNQCSDEVFQISSSLQPQSTKFYIPFLNNSACFDFLVTSDDFCCFNTKCDDVRMCLVMD